MFTPDRVLDLLDELAEEVDEDSGLEDLGEPGWRIQTAGGRSAAAGIDKGADVDNCLLSPGCLVAGTVHNSVISPTYG
ncbi:MAG: hypothetical protein M3446_09055 [Actinomycetota bacterium]|nr:hypothetical protein [Actinomycetota bacterium]